MLHPPEKNRREMSCGGCGSGLGEAKSGWTSTSSRERNWRRPPTERAAGAPHYVADEAWPWRGPRHQWKCLISRALQVSRRVRDRKAARQIFNVENLSRRFGSTLGKHRWQQSRQPIQDDADIDCSTVPRRETLEMRANSADSARSDRANRGMLKRPKLL